MRGSTPNLRPNSQEINIRIHSDRPDVCAGCRARGAAECGGQSEAGAQRAGEGTRATVAEPDGPPHTEAGASGGPGEREGHAGTALGGQTRFLPQILSFFMCMITVRSCLPD